MKICGLTDECFSDYREPVMYIAFPYCTFKCDKENGVALCQNSHVTKEPIIEIESNKILKRYIKNPISKGIVLAGLEPFDSMADVVDIIKCAREEFHCKDTIIIYTGYTETELEENKDIREEWEYIKNAGNIIVKFGRYRPNCKPHFDAALGVFLVSPNQHGKKY